MSKTIAVYGKAIYGQAKYGHGLSFYDPHVYGKAIYGQAKYGYGTFFFDKHFRLFSLTAWGKIGKTKSPLFGIYQRQSTARGQIVRKLKFYVPTNPRTIKQQANRMKLRDAVIAWSLLTDAEKNVYHERAKSWHYWGYHLFVSEYMKKP